jgi:hypothetical protein
MSIYLVSAAIGNTTSNETEVGWYTNAFNYRKALRSAIGDQNSVVTTWYTTVESSPFSIELDSNMTAGTYKLLYSVVLEFGSLLAASDEFAVDGQPR